MTAGPPVTGVKLNPLHWTREHRIAWTVVSLFGALLGVMCGFINSPDFSLTQGTQSFMSWLGRPVPHWPWALYGFLISASLFYLAQLFRRTN